MSRIECLVFGALGGMCPTIASLAGFYATKPRDPMPEISLLIGLGLFALLGAIIAVGFGAREVKAAIVAGIAAPGIVTNVASGVATDSPGQPAAAVAEDTQSSALSGLWVAYAQSEDIGTGRIVDPQLYGGSPVIQIVPSFQGAVPSGLDLPVTALVDDDGATREVPVGSIFGSAAQNLVLPDGTTGLQIGTARTPIGEESATVDVIIQTAPTFGGDLIWALGGKRTYEVQNIEIAPQ